MLVARLTVTGLALAAAFGTSAARAADYSQPPPQQVIYQPPPQVDVIASSWYLRGDIGVGIQRNMQLDYLRNPLNTVDFNFVSQSVSDATFIGGGVGYEFNNWLRFDATAEYRAKQRVYAFGQYSFGGGTFLDTYEGYLSSWVFLANAYVDLGTWNCFTPFVGFGVGGARTTMNNLTDVNPSLAGYGIGRNPSEWHFAYALHAGVAYNVSKTFKVELAYRYLNYGSVTDTIDCANTCNPDSYKFGNLASHDIKLGFRWLCCDVEERTRYVYQPQPYTPPPVYLQPPPPVYSPPPPLRSKG
jgi:opacity protein-like surface antigen